MTDWIAWGDGISVSKADHDALTGDLRLFGSALVETIGNGHGRRIAPECFYMRTAPTDEARYDPCRCALRNKFELMTRCPFSNNCKHKADRALGESAPESEGK
jgi:hypothetical protein